MSQVCEVCGRRPTRVNLVSHAKNRTPSRQHVNLQSTKIEGATARVCTRCLRTMSKQTA